MLLWPLNAFWDLAFSLDTLIDQKEKQFYISRERLVQRAVDCYAPSIVQQTFPFIKARMTQKWRTSVHSAFSLRRPCGYVRQVMLQTPLTPSEISRMSMSWTRKHSMGFEGTLACPSAIIRIMGPCSIYTVFAPSKIKTLASSTSSNLLATFACRRASQRPSRPLVSSRMDMASRLVIGSRHLIATRYRGGM